MFRLDLTDVNNLFAVENVKVGSAATLVCKKAKTTHATEVRNLKQMPKISWYTWSKNRKKDLHSGSRVQNHWVAPRSTQPFILPEVDTMSTRNIWEPSGKK